MVFFDKVFGKQKEEALEIPGVPQDLGAVLALLDGRKPTNDDQLKITDGRKASDILRSTTRIAKKGAPAIGSTFNQATSAIDPSKLQIGQMVEGKGVYMGEWKPTDSNGKSLNKVFDLYAAPEDIKQDNGDNLLMTFNDAVAHVAGLQNWHGHDGGDFKNEKAVIEAVRNNPGALGNWFIPTKEILHGRNTDGDEVQSDNFYSHREKMPSGSEFVIVYNGSANAYWYWSSKEHPNNSSQVYTVDFTDGFVDWDHKDDCELSTRPVRAELRPS